MNHEIAPAAFDESIGEALTENRECSGGNFEFYETKTSEATDAPWRELPGVNKAALDRLIKRFGNR
jgi:hypothetical protein